MNSIHAAFLRRKGEKMNLRKKIQYLKQVKEREDLNEIIKRLPDNEIVCRQMLTMLQKDDVKVEKSKVDNTNVSLYLVMKNMILIGNMEENFTRIQTIAHECIHSIQDKKILKFHFYFSNFYQIFFGICILCFFFLRNSEIKWILAALFLLASILIYFLRYPLERDAMTRARDLAKKYLEERKVKKQEIELVMTEYDKINKIGIPMYQMYLIFQLILKMGIILALYLI